MNCRQPKSTSLSPSQLALSFFGKTKGYGRQVLRSTFAKKISPRKNLGVMASHEEQQQQSTDEEFVEVWVAGQPDASQKGAAAAAPPREEEQQQDSSNCGGGLFLGCCSCCLLWLLFALGWVCPPIWLIAAAWGFTCDRGRRVRLAVLTPSDRAAWLACSFMACASVAIVLGCSIYYGSHKAVGSR